MISHPLAWFSVLRLVMARTKDTPECLSVLDMTAYVLHCASLRELQSGTAQKTRIFLHLPICTKCRDAGETIASQRFPESVPKPPPKLPTTPASRIGAARGRR